MTCPLHHRDFIRLPWGQLLKFWISRANFYKGFLSTLSLRAAQRVTTPILPGLLSCDHSHHTLTVNSDVGLCSQMIASVLETYGRRDQALEFWEIFQSCLNMAAVWAGSQETWVWVLVLSRIHCVVMGKSFPVKYLFAHLSDAQSDENIPNGPLVLIVRFFHPDLNGHIEGQSPWECYGSTHGRLKWLLQGRGHPPNASASLLGHQRILPE